MSYVVYLLRCADGTYYTGVTTDIDRRLSEHNDGKAGAKYTKSRRPVELVYEEKAASRSQAQQREYALRKLPRSEKEKLTQ